ncbi:UNVERIFIED_ORG: hypothetical protein J2791_006241 [Burkholderia contaminans]|jgi:hypothetical protein|nr:hypothetical protein [Burkholderia contaminans]
MTAGEEQAVQERSMTCLRLDQGDSHEDFFNTAAGARLP